MIGLCQHTVAPLETAPNLVSLRTMGLQTLQEYTPAAHHSKYAMTYDRDPHAPHGVTSNTVGSSTADHTAATGGTARNFQQHHKKIVPTSLVRKASKVLRLVVLQLMQMMFQTACVCALEIRSGPPNRCLHEELPELSSMLVEMPSCHHNQSSPAMPPEGLGHCQHSHLVIQKRMPCATC